MPFFSENMFVVLSFIVCFVYSIEKITYTIAPTFKEKNTGKILSVDEMVKEYNDMAKSNNELRNNQKFL